MGVEGFLRFLVIADCGEKPLPELYVNINNQIPWIQYAITGLASKPITTRASGIKTTTKKLGGASTVKTTPDFTTKSRTKMTTTRTNKLAGSTTARSQSGFTTKPKTKIAESTTKKLGGQPVATTKKGAFTTQPKTKMTSTTKSVHKAG